VPAEDSCRFDDLEVIAPGWPRVSEPYPEHPIRVGQVGRRIGAKGDLELVAENEVFKRDIATRSEGGQKTADQEREKWKHSAG
jgi:hypothetical protein